MNVEPLQSLLTAWLRMFCLGFKRKVTFGYFPFYLLELLADLKRKSIEPIALACGVAVRTLQEFFANFVWDHARLEKLLWHRVTKARAAVRSPTGFTG